MADESTSYCPAAAGWPDRILSKTGWAASAGAVAGAVMSILHHKPTLPHAAGTAVSCGVAMSLFSVLQEAVRALRCEAGPANSVVAGAASSYLLVSTYRGRRAAVPVAVWCGAGAGLLHFAGDRIDASARLRCTLVWLNLLDDAELRERMKHSHGGRRPNTQVELGWRRWLPIRHLTDEEWEAYQQRKSESLRERVRAAREGGLPAVLNMEDPSSGQPQTPHANPEVDAEGSVKSPNVTFCGYSIPHPSDNVVNVRVQTTGEISATEAMRQACRELREMCAHVKKTFEHAQESEVKEPPPKPKPAPGMTAGSEPMTVD
ncbi:hypothetical protein WJX81_007679 [Elliptochloris bilobata]|uniref:DNA-directed RNA polymerase RBP11-like dimerisation domain-containing protein n=1 Tax=Elliptochloris bilobata TaxID=381761 RepID=A0AAW1SL73_9CHLO